MDTLFNIVKYTYLSFRGSIVLNWENISKSDHCKDVPDCHCYLALYWWYWPMKLDKRKPLESEELRAS